MRIKHTICFAAIDNDLECRGGAEVPVNQVHAVDFGPVLRHPVKRVMTQFQTRQGQQRQGSSQYGQQNNLAGMASGHSNRDLRQPVDMHLPAKKDGRGRTLSMPARSQKQCRKNDSKYTGNNSCQSGDPAEIGERLDLHQ